MPPRLTSPVQHPRNDAAHGSTGARPRRGSVPRRSHLDPRDRPRRSLLRLVLRNHTSPEPNARLSVATLLVEGATSSGAVRVRARLGTPRDHALIAPLALNGLRVSEALGADVTDLDVERSQRVLRSVLRAASTSRPRNDLISSRDERIETVDCGTSRFDRVIADRIDRLLGCELVRLG